MAPRLTSHWSPPGLVSAACPTGPVVFTCGHPLHWTHDELFDMLARHDVGLLLDARPTVSSMSVAQLRRSCTARGVAYEWQPLLAVGVGNGADTAAGVAAVRMLIGHAQAACRGSGPSPCVLFACEDWQTCASLHRLGGQLGAREVRSLHIVWGSGKLEKHPIAVGGSGPSLWPGATLTDLDRLELTDLDHLIGQHNEQLGLAASRMVQPPHLLQPQSPLLQQQQLQQHQQQQPPQQHQQELQRQQEQLRQQEQPPQHGPEQPPLPPLEQPCRPTALPRPCYPWPTALLPVWTLQK
mmetsp:Transcript_51666/g.167815  ORF Transcript_51666/g.167815 Transcript_51666/m.167815 type:complete len:296 (-) Transcript_51666:567-1454(-)